MRAGVERENICGGEGKCGACRVKVTPQLSPLTEREKKKLTLAEIKKGKRLACQVKVEQEAVVFVERKLRPAEGKILISSSFSSLAEQEKPLIRKYYFSLPRASLKNPFSVEESLKKLLAKRNLFLRIDFSLFQKLAKVLEEGKKEITVVADEEEVAFFEPGKTTEKNYGLAFDLGTTTVVGSLIDLAKGEEIGVEAELNRQVVFGADVVSRLNFCLRHPDGSNLLRQKIVQTMNGIIQQLVERAKIKRENISAAVVAGNTCMHHFLLGLPVKSLAVLPYVPVIREGMKVKAKNLNLKIHPEGWIYFLPNVAGFVGSDLISFLLFSKLYQQEKVCLGLDLGTNGEVVLGWREKLLACSAAAGPAFEGGEITFGLRAQKGAIEKVIFQDEVIINIIGDVSPKGICGSGLIDLLAQLKKAGILEKTGQLKTRSELKNRIPPFLLGRLSTNDGERTFVLADPVKITQTDIRHLQLAKAAIRAGIEVLKKRLKISTREIERVYLAGAFGNYLRRENVLAIGLLPPLKEEKICFIGNAALAGAKMVLLSSKQKKEAEKLAQKIKYIELGNSRQFEKIFIRQMKF